jgi:hypothetical protein
MDAIRHVKPDRFPRGDLAIEEGLLRRLIGEVDFAVLDLPGRLLKAWCLLDADLINVHEFPMDRVGESPEGYPVFRSVFGEEHAMTAHGALLTRPALEDPSEVGEWKPPAPETCRTGFLDRLRDQVG